MNIICKAGHWDRDPGRVTGEFIEHELAKKVVEELKLLLPGAVYVPTSLSLREAIQWVNKRVEPGDLAVETHFNSNNDPNMRGTEAYYSENSRLAGLFSQKVSEALGVPNRGPKHDSTSYVGSLGWLRNLKCQSVLIEACYLTNKEDTRALDVKKIALGIKNAIDILNWKPEEKIQELRIQQISLLQRILAELQRQLNRLLGKPI